MRADGAARRPTVKLIMLREKSEGVYTSMKTVVVVW